MLSRILFLLSLFILGPLAVEIPEVHACPSHELAGEWKNVRTEPKILNRLEILAACEGATQKTMVKIRALEKCHPRDCSWGWSELVDRETGDFVAVFKTFTATRRLELSSFGDRLRVTVITDYISSSRQDTTVSHLMVRL